MLNAWCIRNYKETTMTVLETLKGTVFTAVDTISTVTQTLVEKNRTNAKLNRLRLIMKNESELMNRAYIALGKQYFEMQKNGNYEPTEAQQKLFDVIEDSKKKIAKARECYRKIVDSQNDMFYGQNTEEKQSKDAKTEGIVDITVACSNENEYKSSPFPAETVAEVTEEVKETDKEAVKEVTEAVAEPVTEVIEDVKAVAKSDDDDEATEEELF